MSKLILPALRQQVYVSVCLPLAGNIVVASLAMVFLSYKLAYSLLLGGVLWCLPHFYTAIKLFHRIETNPQSFIKLFYIIEIIKLLGVALLFILMIIWLPVSAWGLVIGYICAQVVFYLYYFMRA